MRFFRKSPEYGCLRCSAKGVDPERPPQWWLRPGCAHVSGSAQVCGPCKEAIERGPGIPGAFECWCGVPPVITPAGGGRR